MKIPRDITGVQLVALLKIYGYEITTRSKSELSRISWVMLLRNRISQRKKLFKNCLDNVGGYGRE